MGNFYQDRSNRLFFDQTLISECTPRIVQLYSGYNVLNDKYTPEVVELEFSFSNEYKTSMSVAIENLNYKWIHREQPIISCPGSRQKGLFDEYLISLLREIIVNNDGKQPTALFLSKSGWNWLPDGEIAYLYGRELVGHCQFSYCAAPTQPSLQRLHDIIPVVDCAYALCTSDPAVTFIVAYIALTTLRSQVLESGISVQTVCLVYGPQGVGKSTLARRTAAYVQSVGSLKPENFFDASSTNAAVREAMVANRDLCVIIDDLCLSAGRQTERKRIEMASTLIRQAANDTTISLMSTKRQKVDKHCEAGVILTAEFTLNNASDVTRCIFLPLKQTPEIDERIQPDSIREAMLGLAEWFQQNRQKALELLREKIEKFTVEGFKLDNRMRTNYAAQEWALECFLLASERQGNDDEGINIVKEKYHEALIAALTAQCELLEQIEQNKPKGNIAFLLYEAYSEGMFRMAKKLEKLDSKDGIIWKGDFCLRKAPLENFIRKQPGYHNYTINKVVRELKNIGALHTNESETAQVHLGDDSPRVYRMDVKALKKNAKKF